MLSAITESIAGTAIGKVGASKDAAKTGFSMVRPESPTPPPPSAGPLSQASATPSVSAPEAAQKPGLVERKMTDIIQRGRDIDRVMRRVMNGADLSPRQLLAMQLQVEKYSREVEVVSRVAGSVSSAVKQTLQTPV